MKFNSATRQAAEPTAGHAEGALRRLLPWYPLLMIIVLVAMFHGILLPKHVVFSNDGPLGAMVTEENQMPGTFFALWADLNSIGSRAGSLAPSPSSLLLLVSGPWFYAKLFPAAALLLLGLSAAFAFRSMGLAPLACALGGLAAALNSDFFSTACWGVASQAICFGMSYLALGLIANPATRGKWIRLALAGMCVGMGVIEGADIGAIFSMCVAAFALTHTLTGEYQPLKPTERAIALGGINLVGLLALAGAIVIGVRHGFGFLQIVCIGLLLVAVAALNWSLLTQNQLVNRCGQGVLRLAVVVLFAIVIALQTVSVLVSTNISGVAGTQQDTQTKAEHWDWATQWSLPKVEALGLAVPGLFGYRMDTPDGGNYWGGVGRDPAWDRWFSGPKTAPQPQGFMRFAGGGFYTGALVLLIAIWAAAQAFRREASIFSLANRKLIYFWVGLVVISLLLAFGRHAPFYQFLYMLPYFSTIRNPAKFIHVVNWSLVMLFAFGVHGLTRRYLEASASGGQSLLAAVRTWWGKVRGFDRQWTLGCLAAIGVAALGWLIYGASRSQLVAYLQTVQFDEPMANQIASFSIGQVGLFLVRLVAAIAVLTLVLSGYFSGRLVRWGSFALGLVMVVDLAQANLPWVIIWDAQKKYATNPVIDFLRQKPYEHRVAIMPSWLPRAFRVPEQLAAQTQYLDQLYRIEWAQHHFFFYNIQSIDVVQMPRMPEDLAAYEGALAFRGTQDSLPLVSRRWELTNTRYLLAPTGFVDGLNQLFDPTLRRFKPILRFDIRPKPGLESVSKLEDLTAEISTNGAYAVVEFTGALPRAKLYSHWQVVTNDAQTLSQLASPVFDPAATVLVTTNQPTTPPQVTTNVPPAGTVDYVSYAPKDFTLKADVKAPAVLLINDKYDPAWQVTVDGQPAPLQRCNFIMRGVYLTPGVHTVRFQFLPPIGLLYVSVAGIALGLALAGLLLVIRSKPEPIRPADDRRNDAKRN